MPKSSKQKVSTLRSAQEPMAQPPQVMSPFGDIERYFSELEKSFFSGLGLRPLFWPFQESGMLPFSRQTPRVDVVDRDNDILVKAEMPGIDKKDVDISVTDHNLTIRAEQHREEKEEKENYYRREISRGSFSRSVLLPDEVNIDKAQANFKDGILEITLPKAEPTKRRNIKIS